MVLRGAVVLRGEDGDLQVAAAVGSSFEGKRARNELSDGIAARVVHSGRPSVVPAFTLQSPTSKRDAAPPGTPLTTCVCMPILLDGKPPARCPSSSSTGSRAITRPRSVLRHLRGVVADALRTQRAIEDERHRLFEENRR